MATSGVSARHPSGSQDSTRGEIDLVRADSSPHPIAIHQTLFVLRTGNSARVRDEYIRLSKRRPSAATRRQVLGIDWCDDMSKGAARLHHEEERRAEG
jgi:hypothetical protein